MNTITYRELTLTEITKSLFAHFNRYQEVKKCWRKIKGEWVLKDIFFTEQWGEDEYELLVQYLHNTIHSGGYVLGAFEQNDLLGFASIEPQFFGTKKEYLQLSSLHVSYEKRGYGIGKGLFMRICKKAKEMGALKLYISSHSSEETQAFYKTVGCVEAGEYNEELVAKEPCDCQLEFHLADMEIF